MASYRGHLALSSVLGAGYSALGIARWELPWGPALLGAGLTTLGGVLPDLDSDSSVPVRELFGLAAAATPFLIYGRLERSGFNHEQTLVLLAGVYLFIRYAVSEVFKRLTVHRGMFHSIPAMVIAALVVFLLYHSPNRLLRCYLAAGTALGFLSHLILDEIYAVDFMGFKLRLNKYAGSALKFFSPSWWATALTYAFLIVLAYLATVEWDAPSGGWFLDRLF
jgi:LexA-binding, inner membrane-associated putative hydrolase